MRIISTILGLLPSLIIAAQITVINPGMEDKPSDATVPQGWSACEWMTTPDILPGYWGVYDDPQEGNTYAGIITRENGTFESFGQRLSATLLEGECYEMGLYLSHSDIYAGYGKPIQLRVWIADELCGKQQLIYTSPSIDHTEWKYYKMKFTPKGQAHYILLEAFYKEGSFSHKGNILIDGMSSILKCGRV